MEAYRRKRGADGRERVELRLRGPQLLNHPMYNRATAFTRDERRALGLEGLLPDVVSSMEQQARRAYGNIARKGEPLERFIGLAALQDRNEHLFYRVLGDHLEEFLPIVYTPTVGLACQQYSRIFRRARGLWITPEHKGRMSEVLTNNPYEDVRLIVVTDNERILGLGDQGAGGMGIPVGKLALYTAGAGIYPALTLPVSLDVGTDNEALLNDPYYVGYRKPRLRGPEYERFVEVFVEAVLEVFPHALLQWEDFKQHNAIRLLDQYRHRITSFNDDIQGTAAVVMGGIYSALRILDEPLGEQRLVFLGSGAAGIGIARLVRAQMVKEGVSVERIREAIVLLDSRGLTYLGRDPLDHDKEELALPPEAMRTYGFEAGQSYDLEAVVERVRPTFLIGTSATPGTFTEKAIREMAAHARIPVVLPLSNPTSKTEAQPADIIEWTKGRALVATGSPFPPVVRGERSHVIGQANNAFIFPGIGLGAVVAEAREVTDEMFLVAAETLAHAVGEDRLEVGALYPTQSDLREVSREVAIAVARCARDGGVGRHFQNEEEIAHAVDSMVWHPDYVPFEPIPWD